MKIEKSSNLVVIVFVQLVLNAYLFKPSYDKEFTKDPVNISTVTPKPAQKQTLIQRQTLIPNHCDSQAREDAFEKIYLNGKWGNKLLSPSDFYGDAQWPPKPIRRFSASGPGSDLGNATDVSLKIIKDAIAKYNVTSMLDIPCGDANWVLDSFETDSLPLYVGLDIVRPLIEVNKRRFAHHYNKQFYFWDAVECTLPKFQDATTSEDRSFDLVHVRDVIQHMEPEFGVKYFCSVFKSEAKLLITTTYTPGQNKYINEGRFYRNDLSMEPFSFGPSKSCTPTHPKIEADLTCIYDLSEAWVQDFISNKCT